jgi:hypothetical protein
MTIKNQRRISSIAFTDEDVTGKKQQLRLAYDIYTLQTP